MRGIYENPSLFNGHIFSYDESAYAVEISTTLKEKKRHRQHAYTTFKHVCKG